MGAALRFFLSADEDGAGEIESESSDESDAESHALRDMVLSKQTVKSGRKRERKVAKARAILKVTVFVQFVYEMYMKPNPIVKNYIVICRITQFG